MYNKQMKLMTMKFNVFHYKSPKKILTPVEHKLLSIPRKQRRKVINTSIQGDTT